MTSDTSDYMVKETEAVTCVEMTPPAASRPATSRRVHTSTPHVANAKQSKPSRDVKTPGTNSAKKGKQSGDVITPGSNSTRKGKQARGQKGANKHKRRSGDVSSDDDDTTPSRLTGKEVRVRVVIGP